MAGERRVQAQEAFLQDLEVPLSDGHSLLVLSGGNIEWDGLSKTME